MLNVTTQRAAHFSDAALTAARLPFIPRTVDAGQVLRREARNLGMRSLRGSPDTYIAPDQSWVSLQPYGAIHRGVRTPAGDVQFVGLPAHLLTGMRTVRYGALRKDVLIGGLDLEGKQGAGEWEKTLEEAGFQRDPVNPSFFTHPDEPNGSWALVIRDAVQGDSLHVGCGRQRVRLDSLPGPDGVGANSAPWTPESGPIDLRRLRDVSTTGTLAYGVLAAARVTPRRGVPLDVSARPAVEALGVPFREVAPNQFYFEDGSFVAVRSVGSRNALVRGFQSADGRMHRLVGTPTDIRSLPMAREGRVPDTVAVAGLSKALLSRTGTLAQSLTSRGFTAHEGGLPYYSHADGSWVAVVDGEAIRGVGSRRVEKESFASPDALGVGGADLPSLDAPPSTFPRTSWGTWKLRGYRAAWLPYTVGSVFNAAQLQDILGYLGFVEVQPNVWKHPDSSEVCTDGRGNLVPSTIRFMGRGFAAFPYENYPHSYWLNDEQQKWRAWVRDPVSNLAPTDDDAYKRTVRRGVP